MAASYDLNAIADALAAVWRGLPTGVTIRGVAQKLSAQSEVTGTITAPGVVVEFDSLDWDNTMGRGSDNATFLVTLLIKGADSEGAQRALRSALSTGGTAGRMKDALEADDTLGGLVSYAHLSNVRRTGTIEYGETGYIGAELVVEVGLE